MSIIYLMTDSIICSFSQSFRWLCNCVPRKNKSRGALRPEKDVCQQRARSASVQMRDSNNGELLRFNISLPCSHTEWLSSCGFSTGVYKPHMKATTKQSETQNVPGNFQEIHTCKMTKNKCRVWCTSSLQQGCSDACYSSGSWCALFFVFIVLSCMFRSPWRCIVERVAGEFVWTPILKGPCSSWGFLSIYCWNWENILLVPLFAFIT